MQWGQIVCSIRLGEDPEPCAHCGHSVPANTMLKPGTFVNYLHCLMQVAGGERRTTYHAVEYDILIRAQVNQEIGWKKPKSEFDIDEFMPHIQPAQLTRAGEVVAALSGKARDANRESADTDHKPNPKKAKTPSRDRNPDARPWKRQGAPEQYPQQQWQGYQQYPQQQQQWQPQQQWTPSLPYGPPAQADETPSAPRGVCNRYCSGNCTHDKACKFAHDPRYLTSQGRAAIAARAKAAASGHPPDVQQ